MQIVVIVIVIVVIVIVVIVIVIVAIVIVVIVIVIVVIFQILSSQPVRGLDFGLSTNGKPLFQVLRVLLTSKIKVQSQQSDSHLSNQTAISAIRLQSQKSEKNASQNA